MNWTEFIKFLAIAYVAYYGINVILDLLKPQNRSFIDREGEVLEFSEFIGTTIIEDDEHTKLEGDPEPLGSRTEGLVEDWIRGEGDTEELDLISENVNVSTGGVTSMQELMRLAQDQSIEVKKQLVF